MTLRRVAEKLSHRFVIPRRLPSPFNTRIFTSTEGGLRYLRPSLDRADPMLFRLADQLVEPGSVVWDIGANMGLFAFAAACKTGAAGRVIAVEADPYNANLLRRSVAIQPATSARVEVIPVAISDQVGIATFQIAQRNRATNALRGFGSSQMGGVREEQLVPTFTLDTIDEHLPAPDVLKIDVEGAEILALSGGRNVLERQPVLICEVSKQNSSTVAQMLRAFGYEFFDAEDDQRRSPVDDPPFNLLALPSSA